ncbi:Ras family protein (macronuclear) [Tetrahymena thermophila SB210]|uniref:Ras family protein n=1 Tax=Tetrahymena thermophila (strain SB210) TaxID=312017 RepID=I7MG43_TETTS|nr:Ras family protein [Tetrahymena thermophila SB210]EAS01073.1 Ras family protein [Tetrahymena thermophila SB210]|eukprot:XP_001021318.1 Ras family protein [Tetrahymena thermophila SB210]
MVVEHQDIKQINIQLLGSSQQSLQYLIQKYCDNKLNHQQSSQNCQFIEYEKTNICVENKNKQVYFWNDFGFDHVEDKNLKLRLKNVHGVIFLYDINNYQHYLETCQRFFRVQILEELLKQKFSKVIIGIQQNQSEQRQVSNKEAQDFSLSTGAKLYELFQFQQINFDESFNYLIQEILRISNIEQKQKNQSLQI